MELIPIWLIAGLALGGLVNYLADVLPTTRRFSTPACTHCGAPISIKDYLLIRPCGYCAQPRGPRATAVMLLIGLAVPVMSMFPPKHLGFVIGVTLLAYFTLVVVTDLEYHLILHPVSVAGGVIGLLAGIARHGVVETLLGGLVGYGAMLVLYLLGVQFGRFMARRRGEDVEDSEALGFGDVNLSGVIGLVLGWPAIVAGLLLGITLGGLTGTGFLIVRAVRHGGSGPAYLPYAPFLILGAVVLLYPPW